MIFVTGNPGKLKEAREILGLAIEGVDLEIAEIQSDDLEEIARDKVRKAWERLKKPCFVEDSGLFVSALNGFPGPYSAYVHRAIGWEGLLKLMEGKKDRSAKFLAVIAFTDGKVVKTFKGEVSGRIALEGRGKSGFGFDPVFIPEGWDKTFAEDPEYKNRVSHRRRALEKFREWLLEVG